MGLKVAIVGLSPSTHDAAPWDDATWEKWGLPWDTAAWPRMDRHFEIHDIRLITASDTIAPKNYLERLSDCPRLYMQQECVEVPHAKAYPLVDVCKTIGLQYMNSSMAYMTALAIHEGAEEIALWGVDMDAQDEYGYQKPNMEYLIGFARGKGIKVHVPNESPLCKFQPSLIRYEGKTVADVDRYGWLG